MVRAGERGGGGVGGNGGGASDVVEGDARGPVDGHASALAARVPRLALLSSPREAAVVSGYLSPPPWPLGSVAGDRQWAAVRRAALPRSSPRNLGASPYSPRPASL